MKKIRALLIAVISAILVITLCACGAHVAEYNGKEILRIETVYREGFASFPCEFVRTFDFQHGKVVDIRKADEEYLDKENCEQYNRTEQIATFTEEQGQALIDKIGTLGFFDWEERYVTDSVIFDGAGSFINVYFADGTTKTTYIYFMDPPNYGEIKKAVEGAFGVTMYLYA